jgi:hypothetical protein
VHSFRVLLLEIGMTEILDKDALYQELHDCVQDYMNKFDGSHDMTHIQVYFSKISLAYTSASHPERNAD